MRSHLWSAFRLVILMNIIIGFGYTLLVTGIAHVAFPAQAAGSLIVHNGTVVGSRLVGQRFTSPKFFQGRPSATTPPYNASATTASNLGPTNPALVKEVKTNLAAVEKANPGVSAAQIPPDLVESSASGIDPDITPAGALLQVPRVASANHLSVSAVRELVVKHERGRFLGIFGDPYVNVLELNLALQALTHQG